MITEGELTGFSLNDPRLMGCGGETGPITGASPEGWMEGRRDGWRDGWREGGLDGASSRFRLMRLIGSGIRRSGGTDGVVTLARWDQTCFNDD